MAAPTILSTDPVTPLESIFNSVGASLNAERQIKGYKGLASAMSGISAMGQDDVYVQTDTLITFKYKVSAWRPWESDWTAYTPTLTNITLGNGTVFGQYQLVGGKLFVEGRFIFGSTSAIGVTPTLTHPASFTVSVNQQNAIYPLGRADVLRPGTIAYPGVLLHNTTSTAQFNIQNATGTATYYNNLSATAPLTFTTGDTIGWKYDFTPA